MSRVDNSNSIHHVMLLMAWSPLMQHLDGVRLLPASAAFHFSA